MCTLVHLTKIFDRKCMVPTKLAHLTEPETIWLKIENGEVHQQHLTPNKDSELINSACVFISGTVSTASAGAKLQIKPFVGSRRHGPSVNSMTPEFKSPIESKSSQTASHDPKKGCCATAFCNPCPMETQVIPFTIKDELPS